MNKKLNVPGSMSKLLSDKLKKLEAPNLTLNDEKLNIVWKKALGTKVYDVDDNEYIDFASGLNVANIGHSNKVVVNAIKKQLDFLLHGMGDFHANDKKIELMECLANELDFDDPNFIFSTNGSDAVDSALKTAFLYTGKSRYISFYGSYHGLGASSLEVTSRSHFRKPFESSLNNSGIFLPLPIKNREFLSKDYDEEIDNCLSLVKSQVQSGVSGNSGIAAIIIEPFQGRGGVIEVPKKFLQGLKEICSNNDIILIYDEILSGFGRTGKLFGYQHSGVLPDIMTIGKALSSGYPISVCCGESKFFESWGNIEGESVHTSTFQGNPIGCTMAISTIDFIKENNLVEKSEDLGNFFRKELNKRISHHSKVFEIRGKGLMIGIDFVKNDGVNTPDAKYCWYVMQEALKKGILFLNGGHYVNVLCLTPPLVINKEEILKCVEVLEDILFQNETLSL